MGTKFGQIRSNADVFDYDDLSGYIKNNSIADLYNGADTNSIARKLKDLEARDDVSFADLSALIQEDSASYEADADEGSVLKRIMTLESKVSSLETTVGQIENDIDDILEGNP